MQTRKHINDFPKARTSAQVYISGVFIQAKKKTFSIRNVPPPPPLNATEFSKVRSNTIPARLLVIGFHMT